MEEKSKDKATRGSTSNSYSTSYFDLGPKSTLHQSGNYHYHENFIRSKGETKVEQRKWLSKSLHPASFTTHWCLPSDRNRFSMRTRLWLRKVKTEAEGGCKLGEFRLCERVVFGFDCGAMIAQHGRLIGISQRCADASSPTIRTTTYFTLH